MEDVVNVTVLRTSDASRSTIKLPLSAPLNTLKDHISHSSLGPLSREHQRIFHLGRELKSGKRSLHSLGFGRHGIFVIHLHSTRPETIHLHNDDDDDDDDNDNDDDSEEVEVAGVKRVSTTNTTTTTTSATAATGDNDCDEIEVIGTTDLGQHQPRPPYSRRVQPVIELLESDDGEDDDHEVVQVTDPIIGAFDEYTNKRRRFR